MFSCITPLSALAGRKIKTLEGLGTLDNPGPVQRAFIEEQAAQCGYCIPGMMMRAQALLRGESGAFPSRDPRAHDANLCRCGTHMRILRAVERAAGYMMNGGGARMTRSRQARGRCRRQLDAAAPVAPRFPRGGGALIVSFSLGRSVSQQPPEEARRRQGRNRRAAGQSENAPLLDSWIRIDAQGTITVFTGKAELGQGVKTALIQVAAEELAVEPRAIHLVTADTARTPNEGLHRRQPVDAGQRNGDHARGRAGARDPGRHRGATPDVPLAELTVHLGAVARRTAAA